MGEAEFEALERARDEGDELPARIQAAMERSDWKQVKEASAQLSALRQRLEDTRDARAAAEKSTGSRASSWTRSPPGYRGSPA